MSNTSRKHNIDINSIYAQLKSAVEHRTYWQERQDRLWATIKRTHCNGDQEMDVIDRNIGNYTHEINHLVSILSHCTKTHKAMNLASMYLSKEMIRIARIIDSKNRLIANVERGRCNLISSSGRLHCDPTNLRRYVALKQTQLAKLNAWKQHVSRYCV